MSSSRPKPLLYSDYINDRAIVEALHMPPCPAGVSPDQWPQLPTGWKPGDSWPTTQHWCHDEVLFIRTHQAFEVWFALIIHELESVVREIASLWGNPAALPRVHLNDRDPVKNRVPLSPQVWPKTATQIAQLSAADPGAAGPLSSLAAPARFGVEASLPARFGESDAFNQGLVLATHRIRRAAAALLSTVSFFDVLATMTPAEFLRFRDRLQPASGFGSIQFRELELLMGLRELHHHKLRPDGGVATGDENNPAPPEPLLRPTADTPSDQRATCFYFSQPPWGWERVARRAREHSLRDVVYALLSAAFRAGSHPTGPEKGLPDLRTAAIDGFFALLLERTANDHYRGQPSRKLDAAGQQQLAGAAAGLDASLSHQETLVAAFIAMHPAQERLSQFLEAALELDGAMLRWRDRHIRFVESMIGMRRGTGGGGIHYLRTTTAADRGPQYTHALPALWQARSFVQRT